MTTCNRDFAQIGWRLSSERTAWCVLTPDVLMSTSDACKGSGMAASADEKVLAYLHIYLLVYETGPKAGAYLSLDEQLEDRVKMVVRVMMAKARDFHAV